MPEKPSIAIMMGDPCGIGPEVVTKALMMEEVHSLCRPVVVGSAWAMEQAVKLVGGIHGSSPQVRRVGSVERAGEDPTTIDVLDPENLDPQDITVGRVSAACGRAVAEWRAEARRLVTTGLVHGAVMAPVNSEALQLAGIQQGGDEEGTYNLLITGPLRVVHLTLHIPFSRVSEEIRKDKILAALDLIHRSLSMWGVAGPGIGVAGLNPHAMGREEQEEIVPAIQEAAKRGIKVSGPVPPDTVFRQGVEGLYDVVLAMYHDQGHIAVKTYKFAGTASTSLGRPYIQTSVAHGTAFDIAGRGIANYASILASIKLAASLAAGKGFPRI